MTRFEPATPLAASPAASSEELRRSFDTAFAAPRPAMVARGERVLGLHLSGEAFALPLEGKSARVSGLATDRVPAQLPSAARAFMGLIAVRGELFPAFDLATIVGLSGGGQRWWALLRLPAPAALAFESLDGLLELSATQLLPVAAAAADPQDHPLALVSRIARLGEKLMPVLDLDAIADAIRRRAAGPSAF